MAHEEYRRLKKWSVHLTPSEEGFLCYEGKSELLEKLFHPKQKSLGSHEDIGLELRSYRDLSSFESLKISKKSIGKKHRFRLGERVFWKKRFDTIREHRSLPFVVSSERRDIYRDLKPSDKQFDGTTKSFQAENPNNSKAKVKATDAAEFTALDISYVWQQSGKTDTEIKMTQLEAGAWSAKAEAKKGFHWFYKYKPSHLKNTWPILETENESSHSHVLQLLLLLTLLSIITFLAALEIVGCKSLDGYKTNSSPNPICQIVNQYPIFILLVNAFNSFTFFLSIASMVMLFKKLPLRPLLLVSAFSMLGAYMCIISGPSKPRFPAR